ncbi:MAG: PAS domain S-box protein [Caldiserica bacterium]|nr:PAS domain S-box protein [Caldisericota bacterium]
MTDKETRSGDAATVQKQTDDALRDAAWRLESIIEGSHVGTWEWNVQTGETVYNEMWAQIIGYTLDELAPSSIKTFETFVHPDDLKHSDELLARHFVGELPYYDYDCRMKHKDGHWVWVHDRGRVITRTGDGKPLMMFGTHTDITERKQAEGALHESEERYRSILNASPDAITITDLEGRILMASRVASKILGSNWEDELPGHLVTDFIVPEDRERASSNVTLMFQGIMSGPGEYRGLRADGSTFDMEANAEFIRSAEGQPIQIVFIVRDISERKRADEALLQSELKYRTLVEMTGTGYLILDSQGRVLDANQEYVRLSGHSTLHDILGESVIAWTAEGAKQRNAVAIAQCARNGFIRDFVTEYVDDGGKITPVEINASVDGEGESLRIISLCRDITERKQAEEALRESEEKFSVAFKTSPYAITITRAADGLFVEVNDAFCAMTGFTREETASSSSIGMNLWVDGDDRNRVVKELLGGGTVVAQEFKFKKKDGEIMTGLFSAHLIHIKNDTYILSSIDDITERKRAEEKSRREQAFFDQLVETAPEGIAITDSHSRVIRVNAEFVRMFGYGVDEAVGQDIDDLVAPPALEEEAKGISTSTNQGKTVLLETVRRRKDGSLVNVSIIGAPILIAAKQVANYAIYRDVTEHKQAEDSLRQHDAYLAALHETSLGLINRLDLTDLLTSIVARATLLLGTPNGFLYLVNPEGTRLEVRVGTGIYTGYVGVQLKPGEGLSGQVWQTEQPMRVDDYAVWSHRADDFAHSDFHAVAAVPLKSGARVTGVIGVGQLDPGVCFGDADIEILSRFAELASIALDNANLYRAVQQDITRRKRVEETLQANRRQLTDIIEFLPDATLAIDMNGRVIIWNKAIEEMTGIPAAEMIGKGDHAYTVPFYGEARPQLMDLVLLDDKETAARYPNITREGTTIMAEVFCNALYDNRGAWVLAKASPLHDQSGHVAGAIESIRDITERKQAEAQLRQSQKMEAIGQLAGGVAHDFNNLLTGILGNIALMRTSLPPGDPLLANLTAAEISARQAADLTKGLLTFSRSAMVLPVPMNITAALDTALTLLKQSLPATMDIVRDEPETAWNVLLDQTQMTQILFNLAVNARDAMGGRGTLTIGVRNEIVGEEYLRDHPFARTGEFVHLSVTDTGPGMSSEVMQHLFEPFYTTKPVGAGTGLGLSVVYGAVKQASGWITVTSMSGIATTFDIYLPRCLKEPTQPSAPKSTTVNVSGSTVLVVEDEPVVCAVAQALLGKSGYAVLTAGDGASALNVLHEHPTGIGLILLDMTMPGMTTDEIVRAVRAVDPRVPILLNSGYALSETVQQMLEKGSVQGFLDKPYTLGELTDKVQELLQRS